MMKNHKSLLLLLLLLFIFPSYSLEEEDEEQKPHPPSYWLKLKALFNHAQSYLFPPNLDFRGGISNQEKGEDEGGGGGGGGGSKVKEAVAKSVGKGTDTVQESAKSAAEKLKETLSSSFHHQPQEL